MISIKLRHKQWVKLAFDCDNKIRNTHEMKQYINDTYHGNYDQLKGFGTITFEHDHQLTWFLLNI